MSKQASSEKMLKKIEKYVLGGNYYEAQQMYKSVHSRYKSQGDVSAAMGLLTSGACTQLKHGQVNCGSELGILLIEDFVSSKIKFSEEYFEKIKSIYSTFPREDKRENIFVNDENKSNANLRVEACTSFLKAAIKWSGGDAALYDMLAHYYWTQSPSRNMSVAAKYFIHGNNVDAFINAIIDCMNECYRGEIDLVLSRGILQYLSIGNLHHANVLFDEIKMKSDRCMAPLLPASPLLNFIKFLLLTLERDAYPLFRLLRSKYKPSIDRDPHFNDYLDEIAQVFYRVQKPSAMPGMLGDIMKMLSADD